MVIIGSVELAHSDPFGVQHEHAALRQVNTADLLVWNRFADAFVAVHAQSHGDFSGKGFRFVEDCWDPETRHRFIAKFLEAVARTTLNGLQPDDFCLALAPLSSLAAEDDFFKSIPAQSFSDSLPFGGTFHRRHRRDAAFRISLYLFQGQVRADDRAF